MVGGALGTAAAPASVDLVAATPAPRPTEPAGRTQGGGCRWPGATVVIDPGHQLGNHNYPRKINRLVPAGGFKKPCNTTGTATNGGYPEATFAWQVSRLLRARLREARRQGRC